MGILGMGGGNNSPTRVANVRITQSVLGSPIPVVMGTQRIQQALLWMGGFSSKKESAGGKGIGGGKGTFYLYAADVVAALCAGAVKFINNVWSGQAWLSVAPNNESITVAAVYAPAQAALLLNDNGVALANTYSQSFTDYGAPAATVLNGTDLSPMVQVPYGTTLTTGKYSVNPASIGTFVVTSVANAAGGNTVYTGTFTGGTAPYGSGASNAYIGLAFKILGFTNPLNNGTYTAVASSATTITVNNAGGVAETHAATAKETGNTYHFAAADVGKTAVINYVFKLNQLLSQELDVVPAGKVITVGGTFQPITDIGVWYYNPGGGNDGVRLTSVSVTPTVTGTYKFHNTGGLGGATYTFATGDINAEMRIKYGYQNDANVGKDAPKTLNFELIGGGPSQAPWTTLTSKYPQAALGYTKIALVAYGPMSLGTAAQVQENTFEVTTSDAIGGGNLDANPVSCILRVLTDNSWGLGSGFTPFPVAAIDNGASGSWGAPNPNSGQRNTASTAYNWFAAQSFFISPIIDSQSSAASHIGKWLEAGLCAAYMSEGLFKLVPYGDTSAAGNGCTWTAPQNFVVALDDTCFSKKDDPIKIKRAAWQDAYNEVQVQWNNRSNQYSPEITPEFDQAAINRYGQRIEDPQNWDFICTLPAAIFAANMRLKRGVNIRNTYSFSLPFSYSYLEPMDVVTITASSVWAAGLNNGLGITNLPVRITKIVDDPGAGLQIEAEDYPWGTHQPVLFNKGLSAGEVVSNAFADPGNSQVVMFEATSRLTGYLGNEIWIGATGDADWGSTNVWVSQDGTKYKQVGTIEARSRLGIVDSTFASGSDPDATNSLIVDLATDSPALDSGSSTDADSGNLLCYVGGEIISYSAATATGQDQYTLGTYIRRGQMGSVISSHAAGALFLRLDDSVFKFTYDPTWAGQTLYFKFQSVNSFGNAAQDLSALTAVTFVVPGVNPGTVSASTGLLLGAAASFDNLVDGTARKARTPVHSTYRPTTSPLTATDAGSNATVSVAAFTMRVGGVDISINSGSLTGLSYGTLYYIYYDDANFAGGAVTYASTTTKETALNGTARFFVGSVRTPLATGASASGNNDGGTGAQSGFFGISRPSVGTAAAFDGDPVTVSTITDSDVLLSPVAEVFSGFTNPAQAGASLISAVLRITSTVAKVNGAGANTSGKMEYSKDGGGTWTVIYNVTGSTARAKTTDSITLPTGQILSKVQVRASAAYTAGAHTTAVQTITAETWIEVTS